MQSHDFMTVIRSRLSWLLCVWMLLPGVARAEAFADFARDTPVEERSHPRAVRILAGVGLGSLAAVAGGVGGALVADALCTPSGGGWFSGLQCLGPGLGGATLGVALGYSLGVWGGGEWVGGDGRLWATMLGATAGFGAGISLILASRTFEFWPVGLALGLVGTHLGYELSQPAVPARALQRRARLQPLLSFSQKGAQVGLGGVF
ncbi:hypothetical protein D187_004910 [Cystobacter fuscus DSM 2262]|uniref:Uncharacterized protein n=2 Tax=Cystobacter fuscus TaxID=43 RepID=S9P5S6_CYSF2|nr:hypothetical protein D187_004910 [Cystobacter fuscus DSM 2262]